MEKRVRLPEDELVHEWSAIEWWYFNGFLEGKKKYAFMTCLFKADKEKVNLPFLKVPFKTIYFAHTLLYNLSEKKVVKEILPIVIVSEDSFTKEKLFINYTYLLRKKFFNYEIARADSGLHIKTRFFDLIAKEKKKPLLEGGKGFIDLGEKTTYYYTYPRLEVSGSVGGERVKGLAWHDKQWSKEGFMQDHWLWFSLQLSNNLDIVCFDYKGVKMATISHGNNKQETVPVEFISVGDEWKSPHTKMNYPLSWKIKVKDMIIETKPLIRDCEMNHGFISYWEGPVKIMLRGKKSFGFMELLSEQSRQSVTRKLSQLEDSAKRTLELWNG
jgi:predicted secreted hydrolase